MGVEVNEVAASGSGLAFVVYPAAISLMPVPQLWSVLFFLMLITIGFGSQVCGKPDPPSDDVFVMVLESTVPCHKRSLAYSHIAECQIHLSWSIGTVFP
ncbi:hypothetical protein O3P69_003422 [Scylla paramamosain]|uniref:Uncharacterized protein n=1 Tax=Scylla paramamosain TaxID=85552 RepID=A0AAW0UJX7_SCYPA